ncbi:TldD protein [Elusimicrobium simillimum]|uniref:TldD/PmbA family protein n=1 Tax=Elusimicrobium simillimum TaxID=3143438 RepID=UPI003C6FF3EB
MKKFLVIFLMALSTVCIGQDVLVDTMTAELNRNFKVLRKQNPAIYYMSYYIEDRDSYSASASLGDLASERAIHDRTLNVDARAGSRKLDNTHEFKDDYEDTLSLRNYMVPVENDPAALKNIMWRATQEEAQKAQDQFLKVKTNDGVTAASKDDSDDFSAAPKPVKYYAPVKKAEKLDRAALKEELKKYSAIMTKYPFLLDSYVSFDYTTTNKYIVTSEGVSIVEGRDMIRLSYTLNTRNEDGMELSRYNAYNGFAMADMPAVEQVEKDILKDIGHLQALQNAPVVEPFTGPVILKNRASGVFFHEILGHRVEGHRQKSESFGQTFTSKVGEQVVSPIISVYDDPSLSHYNGTPLRGFYTYDDEGVKAQKAAIIEHGVLKGFLMGRSPIKNFKNSNGHGRKEIGSRAVSRMGNTIVEAQNPVPFDTLKQMLKDEIKKQNKPYGLIIEDISGGFTMIDRNNPQSFKVTPLLVYRVYPDGRADEIVRGVDIVGTPLTSFSKILGAADDVEVFNGNCGAESGWVPVSAVSPSILIGELEVEKVNKSAQKLPILPNPVEAK